MHTDLLTDHMANPRNLGGLARATGRSIHVDPASGDALRIVVRIQAGRFDDIRFASFGNPVLAGVASYVTDAVKGHDLAVLSHLTAERLCAALGLTDNVEYVHLVLVTLLEAVQDHGRRQRLEQGVR